MFKSVIQYAKTARTDGLLELLLPETCQPGAVWTAVDVLRELNLLARVRATQAFDTGGRVALRRWRQQDPSLEPALVSKRLPRPGFRTGRGGDKGAGDSAPGDAILPVLRQQVQRSGQTVALIRERFEGGALMAACGTGVWLLAQAGCIDRAPIPWLKPVGFEESYPAVQVETQQPLLSGNRWACASVPAWMPMLVLRLAALAGLAELAHAAGESFCSTPSGKLWPPR